MRTLKTLLLPERSVLKSTNSWLHPPFVAYLPVLEVSYKFVSGATGDTVTIITTVDAMLGINSRIDWRRLQSVCLLASR